jgi:23S rRNA (adenine2503-C2)-methyltransferase
MADLKEKRIVDLKGMACEELEGYFAARGEPRYRARQVFAWLHRRGARSFDEMTDLPVRLRADLSGGAGLFSLRPADERRSADGTVKLVFLAADRSRVETVRIPEEGHVTLCVSTQVGCAMGCTFCATGRMGFVRNLAVAEIVDQVYLAEAAGGRISNVVLMGMGEPLHNLEEVTRALSILLHPLGRNLSRRHVTLSTAGLAPALAELGRRQVVNLAVSLNATTDGVRDRLMPINRKHPIAELLAACRGFPLPPTRRLTFEYVLLAGVNDSLEDARRLVSLLRPLRAKVNVIPFNEVAGIDFRRPANEHVLAFRDVLVEGRLSAFVRDPRGADIAAACGQLGGPPA